MKEPLPVRTRPYQTTSKVRARSLFLGVCSLSVAGCARARQRDPADLLALDPRGAELASAAAFDLTVTRDGARLAWAPKGRGVVLSLPFLGDGSIEGVPRELVARPNVSGDIAELSLLATRGQRLALAYLQKASGHAELFATEGAEGELLTPTALGPSGAGARGERGSFSLNIEPTEPEAVSLLARVGASECVDSARSDCSGFAWWRLARGRSERHAFPLSVPAPCREHAVSSLGGSGRLAYAVCSEPDGAAARRTTLFTIQTAPDYARADSVLAGCQPLGLFGGGADTWLVGDCAGRRRAARVGADNGAVEERDIPSPRLECVAGRAQLRAGPIELPLRAPQAGLELLLPSVLGPRGSRAVWAGQALLVASVRAQKLSLARYVCETNHLKELGVGAAPAASARE